jgi:ubiquitin-like-conjugating enzyme ATG3
MQTLHAFREYVTPLLTESTFSTTGRLTAEEFVKAGDFLVYKCPTWRWESGEDAFRKPFLPSDKQYLICSRVPKCHSNDNFEETTQNDNGWDIFQKETKETSDDAIVGDIPNASENAANDSDLILDEYYVDFEDPAALTSSNIVRCRTYDVSITYDKYYQCPRVWLFGYDESGNILCRNEIETDISIEHVNKTTTFERHPHNYFHTVSIHPCKHSDVMKRLIDQGYISCGNVEKYMVVFLKFISTIIPTIAYDFTF